MSDVHNSYDREGRFVERIVSAIAVGLDKQVVKLVLGLHPADQAELIKDLDDDHVRSLVNMLGKLFEPSVLSELNGDALCIVAEVLHEMGILSDIISSLDAHSAASVVDALADEGYSDILESIKSEARREDIEETLSYNEDSAGRIMSTSGYVAVPYNWSVLDVGGYIKRSKSLPKDIRDIIIVDDYFKPIGCVPFSCIIRSTDDTTLKSIVNSGDYTRTVDIYTDQEDVARLFMKYSLSTLPVVDSSGVLMGVISITDVLDIIDEEAMRDMLLIANVNEADVRGGIISISLKRVPWIMLSVLAAFSAASVVSIFKPTIERMISLAMLMPVIASLSGVGGNQTLTVVVRNISTKDINRRNVFKVIKKEFLIGLVNGLLISSIAGIFSYLLTDSIAISIIFSLTLICTLSAAGLIGTIVPVILNKIGLDPALASGTFVSTTLDMLAFFVLLWSSTKYLNYAGIL